MAQSPDSYMSVCLRQRQPAMGKGYNSKGKGNDSNIKGDDKGYNTKGKSNGKGKDNNTQATSPKRKGDGDGKSSHRRANQTSWGSRVRRAESHQAKQQAYHEDKMQSMDTEICNINAKTNK